MNVPVRTALAATVAVGALLLLPIPTLPGGLEPLAASSWADKAVHLALFLALGWLWQRALQSPGERRVVGAPAIVLALVAYGGLLELAQGASGYRTASWGDLAADALGAALAVVVTRARRQPTPTESR